MADEKFIEKYPNLCRVFNFFTGKMKSQDWYEFVSDIRTRYSENHRRHHTLQHIDEMLNSFSHSEDLDFLIAILFHDIIYDPTRQDNEAKSAKYFLDNYSQLAHDQVRVAALIMGTDQRCLANPGALRDDTESIRRADVDVLRWYSNHDKSTRRLVEYELGIEWEYQFADWKKYVEKRIGFLQKFPITHNEQNIRSACDFLISFLKTRTPNIAVYAGSFSDFHVGHLSVLRQAERIFDKVILAVGVNPLKDEASLWLNSRHNTLKTLLRFHQVEKFDGLLTEFMSGLGYPVTLIRGLRTDIDFKQEETQLRVMQQLDPNIRVAFIPCGKEHEHVSSSMVTQLNGVKPGKGTELYLPRPKDIYNLGDW